MRKISSKISIEQIVIVILLGLGIIIPSVQFLYNRSLWIDEATLALNIIHKNFFELLKPLDYDQVAPILFLEIEKLFSILIPNSEYGLRLFPLLSYWAALFFFYKTVKTLFDNRLATILALSLFVFNVTLIYYSSEVKQYMSDILVFNAMVYFILKDYKREQTKIYILSIAGALAVLLSNVAPIILAVAGLYLLYEQFCIKKQKNNFTGLIVVFSVWLSVFAVYYYFFIFNHPSREFMVNYWSDLAAFPPFDSLKHFVWFMVIKVWLILKTFSTRIPLIVITVILLTSGIFSIIKEKKIGLAILTCLPTAIHLLLSGLHLYPFAQRLVLYLMPGLMLISIAGFTYIITWLSLRLKPKNIRLFCLTPVIFLFSIYEFPAKHVTEDMETKESIKYLKENVKDNETIYVYWRGSPSFQYYQDIGLADFKIPVIIGSETFIGKEKHLFLKINKPGYLKNMEKIHGKCWLYFHFDFWQDKEYITNYLDSIGYNKIKEYKTESSSIYLYDFR